MTAGDSRPSLTEARAETAWRNGGRRSDQNEIFRKIGFIDTLRLAVKQALFYQKNGAEVHSKMCVLLSGAKRDKDMRRPT